MAFNLFKKIKIVLINRILSKKPFNTVPLPTPDEPDITYNFLFIDFIILIKKRPSMTVFFYLSCFTFHLFINIQYCTNNYTNYCRNHPETDCTIPAEFVNNKTCTAC